MLSLKLLLFGILYFVFGFLNIVYALNLDKAKVYFLKGDYKQSILEGEKILANVGQSRDLDQLYYILGLSYMKDGNYLRASDIFEIILKEFKESKFKEEAKLGLADTYFLRSDYNKAQGCYKELMDENPRTRLRPIIYYRLSQIGFKKGDTQTAKAYLDKLNQDSPLNLETKINKELYSLSDIYYTVQVGAFSNRRNAQNLSQKLIQKGYPAYVEETSAQDKVVYRVRAGKFKLRQEAQELENKLTQEGYPTKIYP